MPVLIKVNLSRKLTKDFQSSGYGLEIQTELPATAVGNPQDMADASDELFRLAEDLLNEQIGKATAGHTGVTPARTSRQQSNQVSGPRPLPNNGNGSYRPGNKSNGGPRPITEAQVKAIQKMAQKLDTNGDAVAQEDFNKGLRQLSLSEASQCIDNLKKAIESQPAQGAN
jgi:hypothetical protein